MVGVPRLLWWLSGPSILISWPKPCLENSRIRYGVNRIDTASAAALATRTLVTGPHPRPCSTRSTLPARPRAGRRPPAPARTPATLSPTPRRPRAAARAAARPRPGRPARTPAPLHSPVLALLPHATRGPPRRRRPAGRH